MASCFSSRATSASSSSILFWRGLRRVGLQPCRFGVPSAWVRWKLYRPRRTVRPPSPSPEHSLVSSRILSSCSAVNCRRVGLATTSGAGAGGRSATRPLGVLAATLLAPWGPPLRFSPPGGPRRYASRPLGVLAATLLAPWGSSPLRFSPPGGPRRYASRPPAHIPVVVSLPSTTVVHLRPSEILKAAGVSLMLAERVSEHPVVRPIASARPLHAVVLAWLLAQVPSGSCGPVGAFAGERDQLERHARHAALE